MAAPSAAVIVPTAGRPDYLEVALGSIAPQTTACGAELIVVDDGPTEQTRAAAERHGARYVTPGPASGLNAARNAGLSASTAELICFVDDDVLAGPGWLDALLVAAESEPDDVLVFGGPIVASLEGRRHRFCGREQLPITTLDLGPEDCDAEYVWGANLALRRDAIERAGRFDQSIGGAGDEQEWQDRVRAAGGRVRYIADAPVTHRRDASDSRLPALMRSAYRRGKASRAFDRLQGRAPGIGHELRVFAGCLVHGPRYLCASGPISAAHSAGRIVSAISDRLFASAPAERPGVDDFLSGRSGIAGGKTAALLRGADLVYDGLATSGRPRRRLASERTPRLRVLAVAVERTDVANWLGRAITEIERSRHHVEIVTGPVTAGVGKFARLNELLAPHNLDEVDWILVLDDDVDLPSDFLDIFLAACEEGDLSLAQPAHRLHSHAAWTVTRRVRGCDWRETNFVEIGPVTAISSEAAQVLLPFPADAGMGWGLDAHWSAVAAEHGWKLGVVDACPVAHTLRVTASDYRRSDAIEQARTFLAGRPYTRRSEVRTIAEHRFGEGAAG